MDARDFGNDSIYYDLYYTSADICTCSSRWFSSGGRPTWSFLFLQSVPIKALYMRGN